MSDELETLLRQATDLGSVHWSSAEQLRRTARRRTLRSLVLAPVAVLLVSAAVIGLAGRSGGEQQPATRVSPSAVPAKSTAPTTSATSVTSGYLGWIGADAMLQAQDAGPGLTATNEYTFVAGENPTWSFAPDGCAGFAALHVRAFEKYTFMRGLNLENQGTGGSTQNGDIVFQEARRYAETDAKQVMADISRVVSACPSWKGGSEASSPDKPAHGVWTLRKTGSAFAGDESLLISERSYSTDDATGAGVGNDVTTTYAVVRVGGLISVVSVEQDLPAEMKALAVKAVNRLCAAEPGGC